MPLHVAAHSERLAAHGARVRLLAGVYAPVILQITARPERFVAILATVVLLAGVDAPVNDQRVLPSELFGAVLALVLLVLRVNARRMILEVAPLPEVPPALLAFVWLVATMKSFVHLCALIRERELELTIGIRVKNKKQVRADTVVTVI